MSDKQNLLMQIHHLTKSFGKNHVITDIDLKVFAGSVTAIIGPSGAGKSTLLRCLNLLEVPSGGQIDFLGQHIDLTHINKAQTLFLRRHTSMVFQSFNLFRYKTAVENVYLALIKVKHLDKQTAIKQARYWLTQVGLENRLDYYPKNLSGGQQQRVALARVLAIDPEIILLDEPTSALDPEMVRDVLQIIQSLAQNGKTMILVSHEMNFVRRVADKVILFDSGQIIESGSAEELFEHPQVFRTQKFLSSLTN